MVLPMNGRDRRIVLAVLLLAVTYAGCSGDSNKSSGAGDGSSADLLVCAMRDYLWFRCGQNLDGGSKRWQEAHFDSELGPCRVAVIANEGCFLTDDGELLPVATDHVELKPHSAGYLRSIPQQELQLWKRMWGYIQVSPKVRQWLGHVLGGNGESLAPSCAAEFVSVEIQRIVVGLNNQSFSWTVHAERARRLSRLAQRVNCDSAIVARCEELVAKLLECVEFQEQGRHVSVEAVALVRSEIDALGDFYYRDRHQTFPGRYAVDYSRTPAEQLKVLLEYWDCGVWTRTVVLERGVFVPVSIGERVRVEASRRVGIPGCTKSQFSQWLGKQ